MKTSNALLSLSRHPVFWMFALRPENFIQSHVMSNSIELNAISMVWITQQPRLPGSKMTLLWKWDYDHQVKKIWPTHKKTTLLFWKSTWQHLMTRPCSQPGLQGETKKHKQLLSNKLLSILLALTHLQPSSPVQNCKNWQNVFNKKLVQISP